MLPELAGVTEPTRVATTAAEKKVKKRALELRAVRRIARDILELRASYRVDLHDVRVARQLNVPAKFAGSTADFASAILAGKVSARADVLELVKQHVRALHVATLEQELHEIASASAYRTRRIEPALRFYGLDGRGGTTLQVAADEYGLSRERVRQIGARVVEGLDRKPYAPKLESTLRLVAKMTPATAAEISRALLDRGLTQRPFDLAGLIRVAHLLHRQPRVAAIDLGGLSFIVRARDAATAKSALESLSENGFGNVKEVTLRLLSRYDVAVTEDIVRRTLSIDPALQWLDDEQLWFRIAPTRDRLLNTILKVLGIVKSISLGDLRDGLLRQRRLESVPPKRVLGLICRKIKGVSLVGETINVDPAKFVAFPVSAVERQLLDILTASGPLVALADFERAAILAGVNRNTFAVYASGSPVIQRFAEGIYGVRGAEFPPGLLESLPKPVKSDVLQEFGWLGVGKIWIGYRLSKPAVRQGALSIPSAFASILVGRFQAHCGSSRGEVTVGGTPRIIRVGWILSDIEAEPGDVLITVYDISKRELNLDLGSEELLDSYKAGRFGRDMVPPIDEE